MRIFVARILIDRHPLAYDIHFPPSQQLNCRDSIRFHCIRPIVKSFWKCLSSITQDEYGLEYDDWEYMEYRSGIGNFPLIEEMLFTNWFICQNCCESENIANCCTITSIITGCVITMGGCFGECYCGYFCGYCHPSVNNFQCNIYDSESEEY